MIEIFLRHDAISEAFIMVFSEKKMLVSGNEGQKKKFCPGQLQFFLISWVEFFK